MENTILEDIMLATEESFTIGRQMYYMKTMKGFTSTKLEVRDSINNHIKKQIKLEEKAKEGVRKDSSLAQRITVYFYVTMCVTSVVIQTINPNLVITGFVASVSTMMVFLVLVNPTNYFDKELDILNLAAFRDVFEQYSFRKK